MDDEQILTFVREQGQQAKFVTSVCTGALVLGAAGLLAGYKATTHWTSHDQLAYFGAIPIKKRFVVDRNRITGGGVTAGIDFGLYVASQVANEQVARAIQLQLEYNPEPPFNSGSPATAAPELVAAARQKAATMLSERAAATKRAARRIATLSLRAERSNLCPNTEIASSSATPRNDMRSKLRPKVLSHSPK